MSEPIHEVVRFKEHYNTCYGKDDAGFIDGFFNQFRDSFLYSFVLQFILVSLMFANVGKGIYWKVLFYSSLAGLIAAIMENATIAHICMTSNRTVERPFSLVFFLVDEIFWIISEYSIPYLNLIKMKAFARGTLATILRVCIMGLAVPFVICRILIGYSRMSRGYINDIKIEHYHGYAFGAMALADIICTFYILYFVKKNNTQVNNSSSLNNYVKHSSYTILVTVDVVSTLLSILKLITSFNSSTQTDGVAVQNDFKVLSSLSTPLHCLKSSFALILAIDAFLFKYGANVTSVNESSGTNSKFAAYGNTSSNNIAFNGYKNALSNNISSNITSNKSSYSIDMTNAPKKTNQSNIVSPYNYPTIDKDTYNNKLKSDPSAKYNQSIVKNYTTVQTKSIYAEAKSSSPYYQSNSFGFLNTQSKY